MKRFTFNALATIAFSTLAFSHIAVAASKVIYGKDDRKDIFEVTNPMHLKLADSTVVLVDRSDIEKEAPGFLRVRASSFEQVMRVCKTERFFDQPSGGFCSGSLIGKDLMLTAGHCIKSQSDCSRTSFVFNYSVSAKGKYPSVVAEQNVVGCKSVIHTQATGADFAIVTLERSITHKQPLKLATARANSKIPNGTKLVMIGHPAGLPTKVEDGASVRDNNQNGYFVANTDSYGGNSGSAVFNAQTGEIEGVLVRGETDYVNRGGCYVSNVCSENGCRGEDVTNVSEVLAKLPNSSSRRF